LRGPGFLTLALSPADFPFPTRREGGLRLVGRNRPRCPPGTFACVRTPPTARRTVAGRREMAAGSGAVGGASASARVRKLTAAKNGGGASDLSLRRAETGGEQGIFRLAAASEAGSALDFSLPAAFGAAPAWDFSLPAAFGAARPPYSSLPHARPQIPGRAGTAMEAVVARARSPRKPMCPPSRHVTILHAAAPGASEPSSQALLRPDPDPRAHLGASCRASARTPITLSAPGRAQSSGAGGSMK
jgi:hypothetical protein